MGTIIEKTIDWAAREKRRAVNLAVGKSFLKTITEPITNSDSAIKEKAGVPHGSGLIDLMLMLKKDERIDTYAMKRQIPKAHRGRVTVEITTHGSDNRQCRVIDAGPGMSAEELTTNFSDYAKAKALGKKTRSLFGRGALDVLLFHEDSIIYSVKAGQLSSCRIFWGDDNTKIRVEEIGSATPELLKKRKLPLSMTTSGTVVQFKLKLGTSIPQEGQIFDKISKFYMLRLIAADPNIDLIVNRVKAGGNEEHKISYDFPIGTVLGKRSSKLDLGDDGKYPLEILVARSDEPLQTDPTRVDQRENGLLFVDENDAVLDLTLLPEYDKDPYLQHIFGIVRISGIRELLEAKLEAEDAVDVLTVERDGFNRKHEITQKLFAVVEDFVKPIYQSEQKRQKKGGGSRSENLTMRIKDALKALNDFNKKETEDDGGGRKEPEGPLSFSVNSVQLYTGISRTIWAFVSADSVKKGEIVLFESDNPEIKIEPDSEIFALRKGQTFQKIRIQISCDIKEQKGTISALSLDKDGRELKAALKVLGVEDAPLMIPPENIEFSNSHFAGQPNRLNSATLLVNLAAFTGKPEITFYLEDLLGNVTLGSVDAKRTQIKVTDQMISDDGIARVSVPFQGTGWGQRAVLTAKAKIKDGSSVHAKCKLAFERPKGKDKFSDFEYEDLRSNRLGDVANDRIYVNSGYKPHQRIFGRTPDDFNKQLEVNPAAQLRAVAVLVEAVVFNAASVNFYGGGAKGLQIDPNDPMTSLRTYLDEKRMDLEPAVLKALAPDLGQKDEE